MLKEKVAEFIDNLFDSWVDLACDDYDEMESYEVDDPKDYARARMQEVGDDLNYWFDNEFEFYDDGEFVGYNTNDIKVEFKKQLIENGYTVK